MLDQFFVSEVQKNYEKIEELEKNLSSDERRKKHDVFQKRVARIMECNDGVKKEGLLDLEERTASIDDNGEEYLVKKLAKQVVNGTDPELIARWAMYDYASKVRNPYEGILYIITVCGMMAIQRGDSQYHLAVLMNAMTPEDIAIESEKYREGIIHNGIKDSDIEDFCTGELRVAADEIGYVEISAVDVLLRSIDDRDVQRLLREITNGDLAKLMIGLSGEARKRIFDNMSRRLAQMILEDIEYMGAYDNIDERLRKAIKESAGNVLGIAFKLREQGDIEY